MKPTLSRAEASALLDLDPTVIDALMRQVEIPKIAGIVGWMRAAG